MVSIIIIIAMLKCKLHGYGISTGTAKFKLSVYCRVTRCVLYNICILYRLYIHYTDTGYRVRTLDVEKNSQRSLPFSIKTTNIKDRDGNFTYLTSLVTASQ